MTEEEIERLVICTLRRLSPPILVMITAAEGYRKTIRRRLSECGQHLHLAFAEEVTDVAQWQDIGEVLPVEAWQERLPTTLAYRALVLPFLDYPLAAQLVNGMLNSPVVMRLHDALLAGIPVLALRYHCDPASELNQLRGAEIDSAYIKHMQATLTRLTEFGVTLCTMSQLLEKLTPGVDMTASSDIATHRYLTLTDIMDNPDLASKPGVHLTDAATDFLKNRKITRV